MTTGRRRYRVVDAGTRTDAVDTALTAISTGLSFTAACRAVARQVDVSETAVRKWVNDSGRRPQPSWDVVVDLRGQLEAATELNRRMAARLTQVGP